MDRNEDKIGCTPRDYNDQKCEKGNAGVPLHLRIQHSGRGDWKEGLCSDHLLLRSLDSIPQAVERHWKLLSHLRTLLCRTIIGNCMKDVFEAKKYYGQSLFKAIPVQYPSEGPAALVQMKGTGPKVGRWLWGERRPQLSFKVQFVDF